MLTLQAKPWHTLKDMTKLAELCHRNPDAFEKARHNAKQFYVIQLNCGEGGHP